MTQKKRTPGEGRGPDFGAFVAVLMAATVIVLLHAISVEELSQYATAVAAMYFAWKQSPE